MFNDRKVALHHGPDFFQIQSEVFVHENMAHRDDLLPKGVRMVSSEASGQVPSRLSDGLKLVDDPGLHKFVTLKSLTVSPRVFFDSLDGFEDVSEAF